MAIKVRVGHGKRTVPFVDRRTGEQRSFVVQEAYLEIDGEYPKQFELGVPKGKEPYAPGAYELEEASVYVDNRGKLSVSPRLVAVASGVRPAVAR